MIPRELSKQLRSAAKESPSITLTGPRQSGKTTLLKTLFPKATYVHLEEPDVLDFARKDPRGFVAAYKQPVIFDEIQFAPEILPYIKATIDSHRQKMGRFFLTGSQSFALMDSMTESLAGRTRYLHLLPFTAKELKGKLNSEPIEHCIFRGFYPELYSSQALSKIDAYTRWQGSYIRTFVERDVRRISNVGDLDTFERFLRLCAGRSGQLLNLSELGRDATVEQPTAKRWMSVLEAGFVLFKLLPFHKNFSKRLVKSPKLFFYDIGLCRYLLGIREPEQLRVNQAFGALFETMVIADIRKEIEHSGQRMEMSFYRSSDGIEVDLLLDSASRLHAIEIKATATPRLEHLKGLQKWMRLAHVKEATVLCLVDRDMPLGEGIRAIPWQDHRKVWSRR